MQEAEEQDTCRICSAPAEEDQPLFHPCKCSGTIRYIHQDCLTTWLAHSKKKTCDVCKFPYAFTKVYASDMPTRLPLFLLLQRLIEQTLFALLFAARAIIVVLIWLAVLPMITVWTWRMYFSFGDSTAWWISDLPRPMESTYPSPFYHRISALISANVTAPSPEGASSLLTIIQGHPAWLSIWSDIFTGQIIASVIVLTFVAAFLLREWISQNAPPGIFEDEDPIHEEIPPQIAPQQAAPLVVEDTAAAPRIPDERLQRAQERIEQAREELVFLRALNRENPLEPMPAELREELLAIAQRRRARNVHLNGPRREYRPRILPARNSEEREERRKEGAAHRAEMARRRARPHRDTTVVDFELREQEDPERPPFQFTFTADVPESPPPRLRRSRSESQIFPPVELQPPTSKIPFSLTPRPKPSKPIELKLRPTLPSSTIPSPAFNGLSTPRSKVPIESPSLATYIAPEELQAGPSRISYFEGPNTSNTGDPKSLEEYNTYFAPEDEENGARSEEEGEPADENDVGGNSKGKQPQREEDREIEQMSEEEGHEETLGERDPTLHHDYTPAQEQLWAGSVDDSEDEEDDHFRHYEQVERQALENDEDFEDQEPENDPETDWEEEPEGIPPLLVAPPVVNPEPPVLIPPPPIPEAANADAVPDLAANDLEEGIDDDMDGAMEAIGFRGPFFTVIQNAALMIFILDTAIGLCVWLPYTIGKTSALLSLNPNRLLQIIHLPIRVIRFITDPFVDYFLFFTARFIFPRALKLGNRLLQAFLRAHVFIAVKIWGQDKADQYSETVAAMYTSTLETVARASRQVLDIISPSSANEALETESPPKANSKYSTAISTVIDVAEPYFALLGKAVRERSAQFKTLWYRLALGNGNAERAFAMALGYFVAGVLLALYLNLLTVGNMKSAGRAVRSTVRQQLLVVKVAAFIFIELVTFPLGCGIVLDLFTIWLLPGAEYTTRLVFFRQAPLTAMFYHWVAGTMFMYCFAILLSGCRAVMRPGAMWFIKDPQDQNSHPIRDILERPALLQLRKICMSGLMYSIVVAATVGSVAGLLIAGKRSIMPFRWKDREPLSDVPVDLLFLQFALPYTMRYFRPKRPLKRLTTKLWRVLSHQLRLTSYFFGGYHPSEEFTPRKWHFNPFSLGHGLADAEREFDGHFRRVPNTDNIALGREMRATALVQANGRPVDDANRALIEIQNAEATKAKRNPKQDYTIVYIPPHFRTRILLFISTIWVIGAICLGLAVGVPIQLGRSVFALFSAKDFHDGYSFVIGAYLLAGCYLIGRAVDRLDKRRQRSRGNGPRGDLRILALKRGMLWFVKAVYMSVCLGIIIPTLMSIVVDLYIVLPIRLMFNPALVPRIRIIDSWAVGLMYVKIALQLNRMQPPNAHPNGITMGVRTIMNNGWTHPDPISATRDVIAPLVTGLVGMILLPAGVYKLLAYFVPILRSEQGSLIFAQIYPGIFAVAGACRFVMVASQLSSAWSQSIRDKEFLVEMRLRNHDPESKDTTQENMAMEDAVVEPGVAQQHNLDEGGDDVDQVVDELADN